MLMVTAQESYEVTKTARNTDLLQNKCAEPMKVLGQNIAGLHDTQQDSW